MSTIEMHQEKPIEQVLRETKEREEFFHHIFDYTTDAIFVVDRDSIVRLLNPSAERFMECPGGEAIGQKFIFPIQVDEPREVDIIRPGKVNGIAEMRAMEIEFQGEPVYVTSLRDITELVRLREELRALTFIDDLTGLCNRRGFLMFAQQQLKLASRTGKGLFLLLAALDNMKVISDTYGHSEAEVALVEVANLVKETFRQSDIIARISDDQMVILAIEARGDSGEVMAGRLLKKLNEFNAKEDYRHKLLLSMGMVPYAPERPCSIDDLLASADMLLYGQRRDKQKSALLWYLSKSSPAG